MRLLIGWTQQLAILSALVFFEGWLASSVAAASPPAPLKISLAVPTDVVGTNDLDARDAYNRPIRTKGAKQEFKSLWNRSLLRQLMFNLTPHKIRTMNLLQSRWNFWRTVFNRRLARVMEVVVGIGPPQKFERFALSLSHFSFQLTFLIPIQVGSHSFAWASLSLMIASTRLLR